MEDDEIAMLLYDALPSEFGVIIKTNAPERLRQKLYKVQKELNLAFQISIPRRAGEVWLVKK